MLGQNMGEVLHRIGSEILERTKHRFDTGTAPDGSPWAPNRPATKRAKGATKGPLYDTGLLRQQINASVNGNTLTVTDV
ncbi:MAG: phage virion morphogenesis protein [Rhodoferax sp.]|nr:phage virion morphogenesis protein [Rhodoferax sp.]